MRLVFISDTHEQQANLFPPWGDVLLHCGDFTWNGELGAVAEFLDWFASIGSYEERILISGNHDWLFQKDNMIARMMCHERGIRYLQDEAFQLGDYKVWGSPWQPWFGSWAFNLERGPDIAAKWELIPEDTDILLTHGPPAQILDKTWRGPNVGCDDLRRRVDIVRPAIHAFGHIHEDGGKWEKHDDTLFINAAMVGYDRIKNRPVVVEDLQDGSFRAVSV